MRNLYPVFLKLQGKSVLIAGGGNLAVQKLATLEPTGANVTVVAPRLDSRLLDWGGAGQVTLAARRYGPDLLEGTSLVFAATDDPELNHRIVADAADRGIIANAVDDPEFCDFFTPAVVRRGAVTVALSTGGGFPGLARALREVLEAWLPDKHAPLLRELFALRDRLRRGLEPERRREALSSLIREVQERYLGGNPPGGTATREAHQETTAPVKPMPNAPERKPEYPFEPGTQ